LGAAELRAENVHEIAWWNVPDLETHPGRFSPRDLPALVRRLLDVGPPSTPTQLGL
jgi:hypothetical protein